LLLYAFSLFLNLTFSNREIGSLTTYYTTYGRVDITQGVMKELNMNFTIPQKLSSQEIVYFEIYPQANIVKDLNSNELANFFIKNPVQPFTYQFKAKILSKETKIKEIDYKKDNHSTFISYKNLLLKTDKKTEYDNELLQMAINATINATNDFEKIALLTKFVNEFVKYDISQSGKEYSAKEIVKLKKGVCAEYSILFATLARALGYPTRFVIGHTYDESTQNFQYHAWNEVLLGNTWIPVDATWLEVGRLSAGRIVLQKSENLDTLNRVFVLSNAYNIFDIKWNSETNIELLDKITISKDDKKFAVKFYPTELYRNSEKIVVIEIKDDHYAIENLTFVSCVDSSNINKPLIEVVESNHFNTLFPNKSSYFWFVIKPNSELLKDYVISKCPIQIYSIYHGKLEFNIAVKPYSEEKPLITANLKKNYVNSLNEENVLEFNGKGTNYLLSKYRFEKLPEKSQLNIYAENIGINQVFVFNDKGYKKLSFFANNVNSSMSFPKLLNIVSEKTKFTLQELDESIIQICANLENPYKQEYEIIFEVNNKILEKKKEIKELVCIEVPKNKLIVGKNNISARINQTKVSVEIEILNNIQKNNNKSTNDLDIDENNSENETKQKNNANKKTSDFTETLILFTLPFIAFGLGIIIIFFVAKIREEHGV
ncbi:MAG: transglutaminase-like domain-containing protein, partial [Candidatus Anstonellales archaeon]